MAVHANSTTTPTRRLLPLTPARAAPIRDARGRFGRRAEPLLAAAADEDESTAPSESSPPGADDVLDDIARELDRQGVPRDSWPPTPAPAVVLPLAEAPSPRRAIPDPAFAAVRAFDRVVAEWDGAYGEWLGIMDALDPCGRRCWDDPQAVARAVLGPVAGSTVATLDGLLSCLGDLDEQLAEAEEMLLSIRAVSEIGAAALRACVRRYARRPFGWRGDEVPMLARLAA